jgi:diguanylate cyclase (GGDEF)-like protein
LGNTKLFGSFAGDGVDKHVLGVHRSADAPTVAALGFEPAQLEPLREAIGRGGRLRVVAPGAALAEWAHADVVLAAAAAATPELGESLRRVSVLTALVVFAGRAEAKHLGLACGADAWAESHRDPLDVAAAVLRAVRDRRDRLRWPRSFADRRVLLCAREPHDHLAADVLATESAGYHVLGVSGVEDALTELRDADAQALVVVESGGLDGAALLGAARRYDPGLGCAVVAVDAGRAAAALAAGAVAVAIAPQTPLAELAERAWHRWCVARASAAEARPGRRALVCGAAPDAVIVALEASGIAVDVSGEPLLALRHGRCDVVIHWGAVDAEQLAEIRAVAASSPLVVIGSDDAALAAGATAVLGADLDAHEIVARIQHIVAQRAAEQRLELFAERLHELDSRRVELLEKLAGAHLELERMTTIDAVTEVPNRRGLERALQRELEIARRTGGSVVACYVDCDDFRRINERFGHGAGDLVLRRVAERLSGALRATDLIGRVGSDDFLLLLPQTRLAEAELVAQRARMAVASAPLALAGAPVHVRVSVGVSQVPWEASSLEEVLHRGREALRAGLHNDGVSDSEELEALVRDLLSGEGLRALAQPIVRLSDERVIGYELLTRAREGLFEAPQQFLRVARERGILTTVDLQCLKVCLRRTRTLPQDLVIHVNMFPSTLLELEVVELCALFQVQAGSICLELSEEQFIGDPRELTDRIAALRSAGVRLAIDDVGKGRGTLDSVMLLEPDVVKVDRELISGAHGDIRKERLLRRVCALANTLGCEIVGEGVEEAEDLALLRELDVPYAQGFLWSQPREIED